MTDKYDTVAHFLAKHKIIPDKIWLTDKYLRNSSGYTV